MTFKLGLTGSIGMGKSTTTKMFADAGCEVWDADAAVHRLYAEDGAAVAVLRNEFPDAILNGAVSREQLKKIISRDPAALGRIEKIVHPLVALDRAEFLKNAKSDIIVLDIPLLYETGAEAQMDAVACVSVAPEIQRKRVLERQTMSEEEFQAILAKQVPDAEKRRRADYVIVTDTLEHAAKQVHDVIRDIKDRLADA